MEKLNDYLRELLATCGDELRLEPDRNPYVISSSGERDIANAPILGTQISMIVFPLIPADVKAELPNSSEVEFVHPHSLGNFSFHVKKSPSGFNVSIRPSLVSQDESNGDPDSEPPPFVNNFSNTSVSEPTESTPAAAEVLAAPVAVVSATEQQSEYSFAELNEKADAGYEYIPEATVEETATEFIDQPEVDIVSANDPTFTTVFSDTSTYEPAGRRDDFSGTYEQPSDLQSAFEDAAAYVPAYESAKDGNNGPPQASEYSTPDNFYAEREENSSSKWVVDADTSAMDRLFKAMADAGSSDLHLSVSVPPMVRKDGRMQPLFDGGEPAFSPESMSATLGPIMPEKNREEFERRHDTDFAYEIPGLARFRCNVFMDRKGMGAVFRIIPSKILTAEQLGLSKAIMDLCELSKGLVVVTGPTGSGKSTTLCAMVDSINKKREDHIITIEDPIEFVHDNQKCLVNQREVHNHTDSFKDALRAALREDPDILLVGEMRDLETISIAIETAETGHLVFGTLHTTTAASTVDRIIDQFPADRQQQIRVMLSESLKGVIAQTLLPKKGGGRVAALEVLIVTPAISNLIREGKTFQIPSAMQTGKNNGMVMLNDALFEHVKNGTVEPRDAYIKAVDKTGFEAMLSKGGFKI